MASHGGNSGVGTTVHVIAVANQKGGVGKTTTVVNLGACLGALGHKTLLVDCDPQANSTSSVTRTEEIRTTLYEILVDGTSAADSVLATSSKNLFMIPASPDLAGTDIQLMNHEDRERVLRNSLGPLVDSYAYVLMDCPPSLGLLTINALVAAHEILVPVQCEYLALEGVSRLLDTIGRIRRDLNPSLKIFGLVMTMYDRRTLLSDQVAAEIRRHYPDLTFRTMIPRNVRLGEAPSFGQSILEYDPLSLGAEAYSALAREVVGRG